MTLASATSAPGTPVAAGQAPSPIRLQLKPDGPTTGFVDGAWWPRSRDLAAEVPALANALRDRLGLIERVSYHLSDWDTTRRKINVAGSLIRMGGFRTQRPNTVDVLGHRRRLTLLVIPAGTAADAAERTMIRAARPDNTDNVDDLLSPDASSTTDSSGLGAAVAGDAR